MTLLDTAWPITGAIPRPDSARTSAIEAALRSNGCAVVENAIGSDVFDQATRQLEPWFDRALCGEDFFFGRKTKRFSAVFAKAPATAALALHAPILDAIENILLGPKEAPHADCIQLNLTQAIEIGPGEPGQLLHRDEDLFPVPKQFEFMANVMWTIDPFTVKNGATRLAPGSQNWERSENEQDCDGVFDAVAPRNSAIIWLGSLLHGGGANRSARPRRGLVISYSLGWLAPAEKMLLSIPPELVRALPERLQRLIGYQIHRPNLGWVEGRDPLEWLRGETTDLARARDNFTPTQQTMMGAYFAAAGR